MNVQVKTINSVQKSSNVELSSGIYDQFKVWKHRKKLYCKKSVLSETHER